MADRRPSTSISGISSSAQILDTDATFCVFPPSVSVINREIFKLLIQCPEYNSVNTRKGTRTRRF
ncbi:hypothetical protein D3C76_1605690 [compost metagenome]